MAKAEDLFGDEILFIPDNPQDSESEESANCIFSLELSNFPSYPTSNLLFSLIGNL